ncbi:MAG: hypothetical protein RRB13_03855 [bacterium]|nr:hypothetical protein [bacterium]
MKKPPLSIRIEQRLFKGGWSLARMFLYALVGSIGFGFLLRLGVNQWIPDLQDPNAGTWDEALWRAVIETGNFAGLGKEELSGPANRLVGVLSTLIGGGLLFFMWSLLSAHLAVRIWTSRQAQGPLFAQDHSVILGMGEQCIDVVAELVEANRYRKNPVVVVFAEEEAAQIERQLREGIADFANSRLICRQGNPTSSIALKELKVQAARSVVLINPARPWDEPSVKHAGDSKMQMAVMSVVSASGGSPPPMAVTMHYKRNLQLAQNLAKGRLTAFNEDEVLAKILTQTSRLPGLSRVYADLAGFEGSETYFFGLPKNLVGKRFGELAFYFAEPVPLGLRYADGTVELNPHQAYVTEPGDQLVLLAEDPHQIRWFDRPVIAPRGLALAGVRAQRKAEHYLVFGWNRKTPLMLKEYNDYLPAGSVVNLILPEVNEKVERRFKEAFEQYKNIQLGLGQVNVNAPDFPEKLKPERYKAVVLLSSEEGTPEQVDSQTFGLLLKFRSYFLEREEATGKPAKTQLLAEVQRSQSATLMQSAGLRNLMVSNRVLSKMLAQIAEEPDMLEVYQDLFKSEGSEIYLKPAKLYLAELDQEVYFADLIQAAQERGEICFGLVLKRLAEDPEQNLGLFLIPEKSQSFWITEGDQLVVLAPDET